MKLELHWMKMSRPKLELGTQVRFELWTQGV
jgi:hypothetical protein